MSQTIDQRIVEMQFDNAEFERKAATTMSTLEKLGDKLDFSGMVDGLEDFGKSIDKVDFSSFSDGLEETSDKFSTFEAIAFGVLTRIGSAIADVGLSITSKIGGAINDLSLGQVAAGWSKYEQMAQSVATIIAATGMSEQETYEQLNKIAWFSDATSYSLNQMTDAVGKFTAAGVEMEPAVQAIEGIAGAASLAGISATDPRFQRVLYNISQAMGAGTLKLQDWMSIETANMATIELKQNLIQAGLELGTLKEASDGTYYTVANGLEVTAESLRTTLKDGWATSEVMLKTFENYGEFVNEVYEYATEHGITANQAMQELSANIDDLGYRAFMSLQETKTLAEAMNAVKDAASTAWSNIFQYIFGTYEEAKSLWGDFYEIIYDIFAAPVVNLRDILKLWHDLAGRTALMKGFRTGWESISSILGTVKAGFEAIFGVFDRNQAAHKLVNATTRFRMAMDRLVPSERTLQNLTDGFRGIFTILKAIKNVISGVASVVNKIAIKPMLKLLGGVANVLTEIFGIFGRIVTGDLFRRLGVSIRSLWDTIFKTSDSNIRSWANFKLDYSLNLISEKIKAAFAGLPDKLKASLDSLRKWFTDALTKIFNLDENLFEKYQNVKDFVDRVKKSFKTFFDGLAKDSDILQTFNLIFLHIQSCMQNIPLLVKNLIQSLGNFFKKMGETEEVQALMTKVCDVVKTSFKRISEYIDIFADGLADTYPKLAEWIKNAKTAVINFFKVSIPQGWKNIVAWFDSVKKQFQTFWDEHEITNPFLRAGTVVVGVFDGILKAIANLPSEMTKAKEKFKSWWTELVASNETAKSMDDALKSVKSFFDGIFGWVKEDAAMQSFFKAISDFFTVTIPSIPGKIATAIAKVKEFFSTAVNPKIKVGWDSFTTWLKTVFMTIGTVITDIGTGIQNGWNAIKDWATAGAPVIADAFNVVKEAFTTFFQSFRENKTTVSDADDTVTFFDKIKSAAESFANWLAPFGEKIQKAGKWIGEIWRAFIDAFFPSGDGKNKDGLGSTGRAERLDAVFSNLKTTWDKIKEPFIYVFDTITSIVKAIHDAFAGKSLTEMIQYATTTILPALTRFFVVIETFILQLSIWHLMKALEGFTDIGAGYVMQLRMWSRIWMTLGLTLIAVIGTFILIAYMIESGKLTKESLTKAGWIITGVMLALGLAIGGIAFALGHSGIIGTIQTINNKFGKNSVKSKTETVTALTNIAEIILAFGAAILLISASLYIVSKIDPDRVWDSVGALAVFGLIIVGLVAVVLGITKNATRMTEKSNKLLNPIMSLAAVIGAFGWAMVKIAAALYIVSLIDPKALGRSRDTLFMLGGLISVMAVLVTASAAQATRGAGPAIMAAAALVVAFGVFFTIIAKVLKQLAKINPKALYKGVLIISGVGLIFTLLIGLLAIAAKSTGAGGMLAISVTVLAIAFAMTILAKAFESFSKLSWENVGKSAAIFAGALGIIVGLGYLATPASIGMIALGAAILMVSKGMYLLAQAAQTFSEYGSSAADAIIEFFDKLSGAAEEQAPKVLNAIDTWLAAVSEKSDSIIDSILDLLFNWKKKLRERRAEMTEGLFDFLVTIFDTMTEKAPSLIAKISEFLHVVLTELQKPENIPQVIQDIVDLVAVIFENAEKAIENANPAVWQKGHKGVALLTSIMSMLAIDAALAIGASAGVAGISAVITELGILFTAFGAIMQIPGLEDLIDSGIDIFQKLGEALGNFVGGVVGNVGLSISSRLPKIGENLGKFADNAESFIAAANTLDADKLDGVDKLTTAIIKLSAAEFIDAIAAWIKGDTGLDSFGTAIEAVGDGLYKFYISTSRITDTDHLLAMVAVLSKLSNVQSNLWGENGFLQAFGGERDLGSFGGNLARLGTGFVEFNNSVKDITPEDIAQATELLNDLAGFQNAIAASGGFKQIWEGEQDMATFGSQLFALGTGLARFNQAITVRPGLNTTAMKAAADAASSIAEVQRVMAPSGGLLQQIFGERDLGVFGGQLQALGTGLAAYSLAVSADGVDFETGNISGSIVVAEALAGLYEYMPKIGGVAQALLGFKSLATFGEDVAALGAGLLAFSNTITGNVSGLGGPAIKMGAKFDTEASQKAADVAASLAALYDHMPSIKGLANMLNTTQNLDQFADQIMQLASGLVSFSNTIKDGSFDQGVSEGAVDVAQSIADIYKTLPKIPSLVAWLLGDGSGTTSLTDFATGVGELGKGLAAFCDAVTNGNGSSKIKTGAVDSAVLAAKSIASIYQHLKQPGLMSGLGTGGSMSKFASEMSALADGLSDFVEVADLVDFPRLHNFVAEVRDLSDWAVSIDGYAFDGVKALSDVITAFPVQLAGNVLNVIKTYSDNIKTETDKISGIITTEGDKTSGVGYKTWYEVGKFLMMGLEEGIKDNLWRLRTSIKGINTMIGNARNESHILVGSPSKWWAWLGSMMILGLTNSLNNSGDQIHAATDTVGNNLYSGMSSVVRAINDYVDSDMDLNPVITPVVDLDQVDQGMSEMYNRFGSRTLSANMVSKINGLTKPTVASTQPIQNGNSTNVSMGGVTLIVNGAPGQDVNELADIIAYKLNHEIVREGMVFA